MPKHNRSNKLTLPGTGTGHSKQRQRPKFDTTEAAARTTELVKFFRPFCVAADESKWAEMETSIAIMLEVLSNTTVSKVQDAVKKVQLRPHIHGGTIIQEDNSEVVVHGVMSGQVITPVEHDLSEVALRERWPESF